MKRLSRQIVPYFIVIWVAFLALSGMAPCCDLSGAGVPHNHVSESESGYAPADHGDGVSTLHHRGDAGASHDHDSPHSDCCQVGNAEYVMANPAVLGGALRIPVSVFLLATVDAGLLPHQAVDILVASSTFHPPPHKQPLYLRIKRFLI